MTTLPLIMGILNVTPDSFFDGGRWSTVDQAVSQGEQLIREGADVLDVGGESTRPGATPVAVAEELRRVIPVLETLRKKYPNLPLSVDTTKAIVAETALKAGARWINDVSALEQDPDMLSVAVKHRAHVILMHRQGLPLTMQNQPSYGDVVTEVADFLFARATAVEKAGLPRNQIIIDPGLGFGKTLQHNIQLLRHLDRFVQSPYPVMVGASRKSFIGKCAASETEPLSPQERGPGTLAVHLWAAFKKVAILRVHDVAAHRQALKLWSAVASPL